VYNNSVRICQKNRVDLSQKLWVTGNPLGKLKEEGGSPPVEHCRLCRKETEDLMSSGELRISLRHWRALDSYFFMGWKEAEERPRQTFPMDVIRQNHFEFGQTVALE
jgi:hypothetical protein